MPRKSRMLSLRLHNARALKSLLGNSALPASETANVLADPVQKE